MKDVLDRIQRPIEVAVLIALVLVIDFLKLDDAYLKYLLFGLIASLTGWTGLKQYIPAPQNSPAATPPALPERTFTVGSTSPATSFASVVTATGGPGSGGGGGGAASTAPPAA